MTTEDLKMLLSTPAALFALMLFGSLISMLTQLVKARSSGATITIGQYLFTAETLITLGTNVLAFGGLVMTDTLNWTGALGIGYALNSMSDLKPGGRSAAVVNSIPDSK